MDFFEVVHTQKAMRRLKPDPVDDELLWKILDAAICAPNGSTQQPWNFIVVRDPEIKRQLQALYVEGVGTVTRPKAAPSDDRMTRSARYLIEHLAEVPVLFWPPSGSKTWRR